MVFGLVGVEEDFSDLTLEGGTGGGGPWEQYVKQALAGATNTEVGTITIDYQQTYPNLVHMTIRMRTGNEYTETGDGTGYFIDQRVVGNLTQIFQSPEHATVFFSTVGWDLTGAALPCPSFGGSAVWNSPLVGIDTCSAAVAVGNPCIGSPENGPEGGCQCTDATNSCPNAYGVPTAIFDLVGGRKEVAEIAVPPVALCLPATAAAGGGASPFALLGMALGLFNIIYFGYAGYKKGCKKACCDCSDPEGEDGKDEADAAAAAAAAKAAEEAAKKEAEGEKDGGALQDGEDMNESNVNLEEYLNQQFTPGIDDHDDMLVNPVLVYVIEREKKEEKIREKEQREKEEAEGAAAAAADAAGDAEPQAAGGKTSAIKRLGWSLKTEAGVADKAKLLKNIESHLNKSREIEVKKTTLVRASHAGEQSHNVLEFLRQAHNAGTLRADQDQYHHQRMVEAAANARAQLKTMKLKSSPIIQDDMDDKEGGGEEGEEGAEGGDEGGGGDE